MLYEACSLDVFGKAERVAVTSMQAKSTLQRKGELPIVATSEYGKGKVFVVCDSDIFSNENLQNFDNELLAKNLVNWS